MTTSITALIIKTFTVSFIEPLTTTTLRNNNSTYPVQQPFWSIRYNLSLPCLPKQNPTPPTLESHPTTLTWTIWTRASTRMWVMFLNCILRSSMEAMEASWESSRSLSRPKLLVSVDEGLRSSGGASTRSNSFEAVEGNDGMSEGWRFSFLITDTRFSFALSQHWFNENGHAVMQKENAVLSNYSSQGSHPVKLGKQSNNQ